MKGIKFLFSPSWMGILFVIFAVIMAAATFVENDFGSSAAYSAVYGTKWFEFILLLLVVNLIGQLIILKLYKRRKLPVFLFHLAFIIMIIGAGITRYFGWEGTIHIREGEEQNVCMMGEKYISYSVKDSSGNLIVEQSEKYVITPSSIGNFMKSIRVGKDDYKLMLARVISNATRVIADSPEGEPVVSLMVTSPGRNRETIILKDGEMSTFDGLSIGFGSENRSDISITIEDDGFFLNSDSDITEMSMMSHGTESSELINNHLQLKRMHIYLVDSIRIIPQSMSVSGVVKAVSVDPERQHTGQNALIFHFYRGMESSTAYLWENEEGNMAEGAMTLEGNTVDIKYGTISHTLPFSIMLNDFILERYPGSTSPSGYKSDVVLIDKDLNIEKPFVIFMNNILKYKGYRFYQSSYDQDEKGTILSVNHDVAGILVTYTGYAVLFLFIVITLFSKYSLFRQLNAGNWNSVIRKVAPVVLTLILLLSSGKTFAQKLIPDKNIADEFGKILIQDQKGRTKPLLTLSSDILRKVNRENKFNGLTPMQVFLGIYLDFNSWKDVPLIKISNQELLSNLGLKNNYASFTDLVDISGTGTYKISNEVNAAYAKPPGQRSKLDKEIMKVDERVNIVFMIYKGDFLKIFPLHDGTNNWGSPRGALKKASNEEDSLYLAKITPLFSEAISTNNLADTKRIVESIQGYQSKYSEYDMPDESRTNAEVIYYKLMIFERLFPFYATVGLVMLIALIVMVIKGSQKKSLFVKVTGWLLFTGFLFHTFGLVLRWVIAGHAPMSNGYESMIFISWVTLLAGFIFSRRSPFALSATAVLASMTLMVAHLSFMDPEITNLMPVLKSYWLTLHVSVITGSYGFLGLGAILSLIILILIVLSRKDNIGSISGTVDELTVISYRSLSLGLYLLTIGTFLGAVWANESWGRYWGWDPKETWSLITIVIYSIVIHSHKIPAMKDIFTFNLLSLYAFSSVLMTYFGVNYYLSGLHSYASGDAVKVPAFVYITGGVLVVLSLAAYIKYRSYGRELEKK